MDPLSAFCEINLQYEIGELGVESGTGNSCDDSQPYSLDHARPRNIKTHLLSKILYDIYLQ